MPRVVVVFVALALASVLAPVAGADGSVRIGGLDPTPNDQNNDACGYEPTLYVEASQPPGEYGSPAYPPTSSQYIVPPGHWVIRSWSVSEQAFSDQLRLAVVSFGSGATALTVHAFSRLETISVAQAGRVATFPADIPVKGGEEIALDGYGGPLQGCTYAGGFGNQVDIADDGREGTHDFGQNAYWPKVHVNIEATLEPASSTTTTSPSPSPPKRRSSAGDARVRAAILAADRALSRSSTLRALKGKVRAGSRVQRRRLIRLVARLETRLHAAAQRVARTHASTRRGSAGKRDWVAAMRMLARGLGQFVTSLRQAGRGRPRAAKAELLKALKTIARAERRDRRADSELRLRAGD